MDNIKRNSNSWHFIKAYAILKWTYLGNNSKTIRLSDSPYGKAKK